MYFTKNKRIFKNGNEIFSGNVSLVELLYLNDYQLECGDYFVVCNSINETTSSFVLKDLETVNTVNNMDRVDRAEYLFTSMV